MIAQVLIGFYCFMAGLITAGFANDFKFSFLAGVFWLPLLVLISIRDFCSASMSYLTSKSRFIDFCYAWATFIWLRRFNPMPMRGIMLLKSSDLYTRSKSHKKLVDKLIQIYKYNEE